jgi:hypothetical protein
LLGIGDGMPVAFAEGAITQQRRERKVRLGPEEGDAVWERICLELRGVPTGPTTVTTVYFDRPGLPLARRAERVPEDCTKIRAKHYDPDRSGDGSRVVLEVKRERAGVTTKERVWVPRGDARAVLAGTGAVALSVADARLAPVVAVRYERHVFQTCATWRVTLDRRLAFHDVGWSAFDDGRRLAPPFARSDAAILELKYAGDGVPAWLAGLVDARARRFSKFVEAVARLRARTSGEARGC